MSWRCPHCNDAITELKYNVNTIGYEYGAAELSDRFHTDESDIITDHNCQDSEGGDWDNNSPSYECPECSAETDAEALVWDEDDENNEEEEETPPPARIRIPITPQIHLEEELHAIRGPEIQRDYDSDVLTIHSNIVCKNCKHPFIICIIPDNQYRETEEIVECTNCGQANTQSEFMKLLDNGFFD